MALGRSLRSGMQGCEDATRAARCPASADGRTLAARPVRPLVRRLGSAHPGDRSATSWKGSTAPGGSSAAGASRSSPVCTAITRTWTSRSCPVTPRRSGSSWVTGGRRGTSTTGWFRPFDHRFTEVRPDSQVWVRRDAQSPLGPRHTVHPGHGWPLDQQAPTRHTPRTLTTSPGSHRTGCVTPTRR